MRSPARDSRVSLSPSVPLSGPWGGWWAAAAGFRVGNSPLGVSRAACWVWREVLIPALVLVFGADVKTAGTGSVFLGLATVAVGVAR